MSDPKPDAPLMKIDLHCHSEASWDCITPLETFPTVCKKRGIHVQAITDHNEVWGAQELQQMVAERDDTDLTVIVGEEVTTTEGEIIGLFLKEKIPSGLSPEETVAAIKEQGGLVLLPHGFDPLKRYRLQPDARARVEPDIDIIETFNARVSRRKYNAAAFDWADERDLAMSAGTDAHTLSDVGSAWVAVPRRTIETPADLLAALPHGDPEGKWVHPWLAFGYKIWDMLRHKLRRMGA